jgi:adenylate cyclase
MERRLAAILAADVVGYSRLMGADEAGTLTALKAHREGLIDPLIAGHNGRTVKLMGDGALVEFASVVDAVACAVAVQRGMAERNAEAPTEQRIDFRIGINIGDVIVEGDDIYGDGVNIAARLEGLAEPGGICISGDVFRQVRGKLDLPFDDLGEQALKNIAEPIRTYRIAVGEGVGGAPGGQADSPTLPDKPSIAVLPFDNMSGDADQAYFADGITEDIITELSRFRQLFVIARNSSFTYRGRSAKVQDVAKDLGVRYVVEGSVRKAGNRVRVTAQLVDAQSGSHLWAERYDRELADIFAVQDEITRNIVAALPGRLEEADRDRARRKRTSNMTAHDYLLLGLERFRRFSPDENAAARELFQQAIALDPLYARAHTMLASTDVWDVMTDASHDDPLDAALGAVRTALALDNEDGWSHAIHGFILFLRRRDDEAEAAFRRAVALNPNDADTAAFLANVLVYWGRWQEALDWFVQADRLNPYPPGWYHWYRALALYSGREYEQAVRAIREIRPLFPMCHAYLAACHAQLDRPDEAEAELAAFTGGGGGNTALELARERADRYRDPADRDHFLDGLRKAGLAT